MLASSQKYFLQADTENNDFFLQSKSNSLDCSHTHPLLWNMTIVLDLVDLFYFEYFLEAREKEKLENAISYE